MKKPSKLSPAALGLAIKTLRDQARMSANDLALQAGMTPSSLSRTENGFRQVELAEATLIAEALGAKVDDVVRIAREVQSSGIVKQRERAMAELHRSMAQVKEAAVAVMAELQRAEGGNTSR
jgi:transcriptional regulator with XRE-family HTH domain